MKDKAKILVRLNWLFDANLSQFRFINNVIKKADDKVIKFSVTTSFIRKINLSNTLLKQAYKEYGNLLRNNLLNTSNFNRIYNLYIKRSGIIFQESLIYLNQMRENKLITMDFYSKINSLKKMMIELEKYFIYLIST